MNCFFKMNYLYLITIHTYKNKAFENISHDKQSTNLFSERVVPVARFTIAGNFGKKNRDLQSFHFYQQGCFGVQL